MMRWLNALLRLIGAVALVGLLMLGGGLLYAGHWLTSDDVPSVADAIVVLGGDYHRPAYAAELYRKGYAPLVYVSRVAYPPTATMLEKYGVTYPRQEDVYQRILITEGVPPEAIRLHGDKLLSTIEEAESIASRLGPGPGRLIVVTSPPHIRRAGKIFRDVMPGWTIMMTAIPDPPFPDPWWSTQASAREVLLELSKTAFYMFGGAFRSSDEAGQQ
ncbi:YdcF family protein [Desulfovibrio subterraneus]|jgi:uncharacterized SAM-binding protein YcdF (DUF218 family)|uniref:DUF218 domain-containing protein n=1 Tax=Desulfovibrio subterraneus TaxID=2718620 RepID=A0A7J0BGK3_9BACT|nr:YdcF family protein [Desulfovibrio subterraneus]WBF69023.1 YdcF family protein [Desulfovibrio subterraneus]GFM32235.1 hypothetical protein DSM101010T_06000 [Desulfovibrio subterraneus]